jgi:hypothetical protein
MGQDWGTVRGSQKRLCKLSEDRDSPLHLRWCGWLLPSQLLLLCHLCMCLLKSYSCRSKHHRDRPVCTILKMYAMVRIHKLLQHFCTIAYLFASLLVGRERSIFAGRRFCSQMGRMSNPRRNRRSTKYKIQQSTRRWF